MLYPVGGEVQFNKKCITGDDFIIGVEYLINK